MVITFIPFNVNGLNHPGKRSALWKEALKLGPDILCFQESHFHASNTPTFKHRLFPHIFLASAPMKQRGLSIAIKNSVAFNQLELHADPEGRYLILICELNNKSYTIANIYSPNSSQLQFVRKMLRKIIPLQKGALLICGDFNITADHTLDMTTKAKWPSPALQPVLHVNNLYDVWRCQHANERDYSFHSLRHNTYSRIDAILVDRMLLQSVSSSSIHTISWSNHTPVSIVVQEENTANPTFIWRANSQIILHIHMLLL